MTQWDPELYLKFGDVRTRAAADLLARVALDAPKRIVDIGCGPGNSTALLRARFPNADILGVDSSADMLRDAASSGIEARWQEASFETWRAEAPCDLIFANAALQWADDPIAVTLRLYEMLAPGGVIALQVPQNYDQPSHVAVIESVEAGPWSAKLTNVRRYDPGFARGGGYARALAPRGAGLDIWTSEYLHILDDPDPVFRFMSGTGLRPFVQALGGAERDAFEADVRARLGAAYPAETDGRTFFPFRRLFVIATRA